MDLFTQKTRVIYVGQSHTLIEWLCLKSDVELLAIFVPRTHYQRSAWVSLSVHYQIKLYWADHTQEIEEYLSTWRTQIDLGICAYFKKLSLPVIHSPRLGFINIHPGILPNYPGRLPSMEAIYAGEKEAGVSIHWMNERLDQGDLIDIRFFPVLYQDGPAELEQRAMQQAIYCLQEHWQDICQGQAARFAQKQSAIHKSPRWRLSPSPQSSLREIWQSIKAYQPFGGLPFLLNHSSTQNSQDRQLILCIMHACIDYEPSVQEEESTHLEYPYHIKKASPTLSQSIFTRSKPTHISVADDLYVLSSHSSGWQLLFYYRLMQYNPLDIKHQLTEVTESEILAETALLYPISDDLKPYFPF